MPATAPTTKLESPRIFDQLMTETREQDESFEVRTPDPVAPSFVNELRKKHYPDLLEFEENSDLEVVVTEIDDDPNNLHYDVVGHARHP